MKEKPITKRSKEKPRQGKTDWEALDRLSDDDIAAAVEGDADAMPLDIDWSGAELKVPPPKKAISIRLDEDIVDYFRKTGPGYQTRINAVLRHYLERRRGKTL
ncbi:MULTISPECIES: BrnA antitoxin family protein [Rhodomicrobium]|uniref:BrnA antitoxin family protein n=1 Tax=Rhodomicrobium TaxID=1068 RepID=UPI000B4A853E|nr:MULTISPECIES: BrnA antitoxin family protein [Rhodomicrobium]